MIYLISYDLRKPGRDYAALHQAIKQFATYYHCLESVWIVESRSTAIQIRDQLIRCLDPNDALLVVKLDGEAAWFGLPSAGSNWLQSALAA